MQKALTLEMDKAEHLAAADPNLAKFQQKFKIVDRILVLELRDDGRRDRVIEMAKACGILEKLTFFTAIDGKKYEATEDHNRYTFKVTVAPPGCLVSSTDEFWEIDEQVHEFTVRRAGLNMKNLEVVSKVDAFGTGRCTNAKEVACTAGHIVLSKYAKSRGWKTTLIMESDCFILASVYWVKTLQQVIDQAPSEWNCVSLNNTMLDEHAQFSVPFLKWSDHLQKDKKTCWGLQCYLLSEKGALWLTEKYFSAEDTVHLDCSNNEKGGLYAPHADGVIPRCPNSYVTNLVGLPSDQRNVGKVPMHKRHLEFHGEATLCLLIRFRLQFEAQVSLYIFLTSISLSFLRTA
jgi:hypothetical protein